MDEVKRLNDSKCDISVSESGITDSYKIPYVLFNCPSRLSFADNRSLLYFSSPDKIYCRSSMEDLLLPAYLQFVFFTLIEDKWKIYVGLRTNSNTQTHTRWKAYWITSLQIIFSRSSSSLSITNP